jgi:hypothetical protein
MKRHLYLAVLLRLGCLKSRRRGNPKLKSPPVPAIREQLIEGPVLSQQLHSAMELQPPVERLEVVLVVMAVVVAVARSAHQ